MRPSGATACNRCADRGLHCELSSNITPQRPSPYPATNATPSSSSKLPSRAIRGPSATPGTQQADLLSTAAPASSAMPDAPAGSFTSVLDSTQVWNTSAHFSLQSYPQQQLSNVAAYPGIQNQLAWMGQNAAMLNRSTVRYNRPNIWPGPSNGAVDPSTAAAGTQNPAGSLPAQNSAADMTALFNMLNNNSAAAGAAAPNAGQWNQGYTNSMDNIMLDDFVNELMSLTGPLAGGEGTSTVPPTSETTPIAGTHQASPFESRPHPHSAPKPSNTPSSSTGALRLDANAATSTSALSTRRSSPNDNASPASAQPKSSNGKAATSGRASNRYRKLLDSDAIESLLSKYSPIYERFWHATLMLLSNKKRQAAVDYLMSVIRSNKACRASVVVVCLAYHELVQRVRKSGQKADAKQLSGSRPPNWTSVATDAVNGGRSGKPAESGMVHTVMSMFPADEGTTLEGEHDDDMRAVTSDDEDHDVESEEEISTIESRRSSDRRFASSAARPSSERYGSTSFSRRSASTPRSPLPASRSLTGKLSTVEDNIQEMDDPERDAFKGQKVEEHTVELWFDIAQAELRRSREELSLDQELCAIINLRWACLCFAGAERARQLTEELGRVMQREGIDMARAAAEEKRGSFVSVMVLTAVYTDVLDTVSDRGKRTHVALRSGKGVQRMEKGGEEGEEPFFGRVSLVSLELLTCFKLISDLAADVWGPMSGQPSRPSAEEVEQRSSEIERKIMSLPPWIDPNTSSSLRVRAFALQEIWRQTARLILLQSVHRRGPLFPELQTILHEIIRLAKTIKIQSLPSLPTSNVGGLASTFFDDVHAAAPFQMWLDVASWEMCTVWFLCATVALTKQDREFCIHHLESLGLERSNRDNIQVVRDYWARQDETGCTLDWFDFVKSTGRSVVFAF